MSNADISLHKVTSININTKTASTGGTWIDFTLRTEDGKSFVFTAFGVTDKNITLTIGEEE